MKFSVGYQLSRSPAFLQEIIRLKERIGEVYFSWGSYPNGRNNQLRREDFSPEEAMLRQEQDLQELAEAGIPLNLLFNATCYGKDSQSRAFFQGIGDTVDQLQRRFGLAAVTTTSPLIARFLKSNFPGLERRASVNMEIGTVEGMEYLQEEFDSFYARRELNRDLNALSVLKNWCDQRGKKLYGLANSGCLNHCSAHIFHDNLVAHEEEIAGMDNGFAFEGVCKRFWANPENREQFPARTNFIRPEDTGLYEELFAGLKLATRVSPYPLAILRAYAERGAFRGNLPDLLEPCHSGSFYPDIIENSRLKTVIENGRLRYEHMEEALIRLEDGKC